MHTQRFTALRRRATPALKSAGKFIIISAVTYAPGGLAGWAVKSVARRPLRLLLAGDFTCVAVADAVSSGVSSRSL